MIKAIIILAILATAAHARPREFSIGLAEQQTKGLVAYYPMLVSGATVTDRSGNGRNGTAVNSPTFSYANGYVGDGVSLNGTSQYIDCGTFAAIHGATALTVSVWVYPTSFSQADTAIIRKWTAGAQSMIFGFLSTSETADAPYSGIRFAITDGTNYRVWHTAAGTLTINAWQHVAAVWSGGATASIYVDGVSQTVSTSNTGGTGAPTAVNPSTERLAIGARYSGGTPAMFYAGRLDEVRIWNRALSAAEIKQRWRDDTVIHRGR